MSLATAAISVTDPTRSWFSRIRAWSRLSIAGSLATLALSANAVELTIEHGLVSVEAEDVTVQEILQALSEQQGLRLVQQSALTRRIDVHADRVTVPFLLDSVLELSDSYQLFLPEAGEDPDGAAQIPPTLWLFAEGTGEDYAISFHETVLLRGGVGDRKEAVRRLRDIATPAAVNALSVALSDSDERVRNAAIEALSNMGSEAAVAALASMAADDDVGARARAAESLGRADGAPANSYLETALADPDPRVRMAAAEGLADLDNPASRKQLASALKDPDPLVRQRVADILEELDDEAMFHALFPPQ